MRLSNKIGIVTAAGSGMGRAGAIRFAAEGAAAEGAVADGVAAHGAAADGVAAEGVAAESAAVDGAAADGATAECLPGVPGLTDGRPQLVFFQHDEVIVHCPASLAGQVAAAIEMAAAGATRLVFGATEVSFPMTTAIVSCYADAK